MKDPLDKETSDLYQEQQSPDGIKKKPGRPPKGEKAMSAAEKQRAYRARKKAEEEAALALLQKTINPSEGASKRKPKDFGEMIKKLSEPGQIERIEAKLDALIKKLE